MFVRIELKLGLPRSPHELPCEQDTCSHTITADFPNRNPLSGSSSRERGTIIRSQVAICARVGIPERRISRLAKEAKNPTLSNMKALVTRQPAGVSRFSPARS